jgi:predicted dehydrogenase
MIAGGKIRCGVIGAGWWATYAHLPALKEHPMADVVVVQSREIGKARMVARDFRVENACATVDELLAIDDLHAVVVATTPNVHFAQCKAALDRGLHVLIEKPMTFTAAEARELVELAKEKRCELLISCPWHFTAHGLEAQKLIRSGRLGEIKMISVLMTNPIDKLLRGKSNSPTHGTEQIYVRPRKGSYSDPSVAGGGQIYCQVSHVAAYLTFLTGYRAAEVFARFDNDETVNDIYDAISIRLENDTLVSIASTAATPLSERTYELRIFGSRAILQMELWRGR